MLNIMDRLEGAIKAPLFFVLIITFIITLLKYSSYISRKNKDYNMDSRTKQIIGRFNNICNNMLLGLFFYLKYVIILEIPYYM